jgi:hypothetical protein
MKLFALQLALAPKILTGPAKRHWTPSEARDTLVRLAGRAAREAPLRRSPTGTRTGNPASHNLAVVVVHGGLLLARGKEKDWDNSLYSTTRSSYESFLESGYPSAARLRFFRVLDSVPYIPG